MRYRITQFHPVIIINHTIPFTSCHFTSPACIGSPFSFSASDNLAKLQAIKHFGICSIFRISGSVYQIAWNLTLTLINTKRFKGVNHTIFLVLPDNHLPIVFHRYHLPGLRPVLNLIGILHIIRQSIVGNEIILFLL